MLTRSIPKFKGVDYNIDKLILPTDTGVRTGGSRLIEIDGGYHVWTKKVGDAPVARGDVVEVKYAVGTIEERSPYLFVGSQLISLSQPQ